MVFLIVEPNSIYQGEKMKSLKWILLGVYLILSGLILLGVSFSLASVIAGVCALIAGILFIINR